MVKLAIDISRNLKTVGDNPSLTKTKFVVVSRAIFAALEISYIPKVV